MESSAMPDDQRCVLQLIQKNWLRTHPDSFGPEQDICDISLWLRQKFPLSNARVLVNRHYTQRSREIADFAVTSVAAQSACLAEMVFEAFLALGYNVQETGGDMYQCPSCSGHHSKHEKLTAYARIESALHARRPR